MDISICDAYENSRNIFTIALFYIDHFIFCIFYTREKIWDTQKLPKTKKIFKTLEFSTLAEREGVNMKRWQYLSSKFRDVISRQDWKSQFCNSSKTFDIK